MTLATSDTGRPFINLSNRAIAKRFWERIQNHWDHQHLPSGQRFLGSVGIERESTEEILDIVGENLGRLESVTSTQLRRYFGEYETNWIKFLTFALSEYAYYDDGNHGYWQGLCDRLDIYYSQGTTHALQQVVWQGIKELGLVKSSKANRYVSSLWLQSGIPCQNLGHFADLIQALDYDWWDIAHADPVDLAQLLCDVCQHRFPNRGRLLTFLRSSCPEDHEEEADPISGTLLQGLASVAYELERRGESPEILRDELQRTRILQNYSLPNTFFLRSWDSLINVLTPRSKKCLRPSIISQRRKPLSLLLDITDSFDIQLLLPEQEIYRKEWKQLQAEYCTIPEGNWEGTINIGSGVVKIPELRQTLTQSAVQWAWQLRSHSDRVLLEWQYPGIQPDQLCLIFDADTGEWRSPEQLQISSEIILFTPNDVEREYGENIELIDSFIPCSLQGWRGHLIQRKGNSAEITLQQGVVTKKISWQQSSYLQPKLQGIHLKSHHISFLGTPTLWHPPGIIAKTLNILIEDLKQREAITQPNEQITIAASTGWQEIDLHQWIQTSGTYNIRLWNSNTQWSEIFQIQEDFQLSHLPSVQDVNILDRQKNTIQEFPADCLESHDFWLEELTIKGLWPLEELDFDLTNGEDKVSILRKVDGLGDVVINLASFRDVLAEADRYSLTWLREGKGYQLLSFNFNKELWSLDQPENLPASKSSSTPIGVPPVKTAVYWIEIGRSKAKQLQQLLTSQIQAEGLAGVVSISYDKSLSEFVIVRLSDQKYEPVLKEMCSSVEKRLYRKINLINR